ncbi:6777_t:CDS:2, partial [Racocetra persica]
QAGADDAKLNGLLTKREVLNGDWQEILRAKTTKDEINYEKSGLKSLIDKAKEETDKTIRARHQAEQLLGNWENILFSMKTEAEIKAEQSQLLRKITDAKKEELTQQQNDAITKENQEDGLIDDKTQAQVLSPNWQDIEKESSRQNTSGTRKKTKEENKLNKDLQKLRGRDRTFASRSLTSLSIGKICGEITSDKRNKIFRILSELKGKKRLMKGDEIEKNLQEVIKFIDVEETKDSKEVIDFRNSTFKSLIKEGIDNELTRENLPVPYNDLTGNPKEDIPQITSKQDKLNALEAVLKEIKEKRQEIAAKNVLQESIDKLIPYGNHGELKDKLKKLQQLIPQNNDISNRTAKAKNSDGNDIELSEAQIKAYQNNKNAADNKELELVYALDLLRNAEEKIQNKFQMLDNAIVGINQKEITDAAQELERLHRAQTRIDELKTERDKLNKINTVISNGTESVLFEEGGVLDTQIRGLH